MKLKSIEFILENCDSIVVDGKYIGYFDVSDIKSSISRIACNSIARMDVANTVVIETHNDANKKRHLFECDEFEEESTFDRLCAGDVTRIMFDLIDEFPPVDSREQKIEHYDYYVDWVGCNDDDSENKAQTTYVSDLGNLYLVISKEKSVEDFFNKEEINDKDYVDFTFDMCSVGDKYGNPERYNKSE